MKELIDDGVLLDYDLIIAVSDDPTNVDHYGAFGLLVSYADGQKLQVCARSRDKVEKWLQRKASPDDFLKYIMNVNKLLAVLEEKLGENDIFAGVLNDWYTGKLKD